MHTDILLVSWGATYTGMREAAIAAEAAGFEGVWTFDHLTTREQEPEGPGVPECLTALAGLAEVVPRVKLGVLVANVQNRHPAILANSAATVQQISGGRFMLGIGAGGGPRNPYAVEQVAIGRDVEPDAIRANRVVETVEVVRRLWAGDARDYTGSHYALKSPQGYLRPDPAPPIIVGAFGPRMARIAGRYGDGVNTWVGRGEVIEAARQAREDSGGEPLLATMFGGLAEHLALDAEERAARYREVALDRLILQVHPPFDLEAIAEAGRELGLNR